MASPTLGGTPIPATNNQVQLGVVLAAHYTATRASVDDWLRRRDQYLTLFVTGTAAAFGVYLTKTTSTLLLYLVSPITVVVLLAYISADLHVAFLCKWLKFEYTSLLEQYVAKYDVISLAPWHWDNSQAVKEFYARGTGLLRYIFLASTLIGANIIALMLVKAVSNQIPRVLILLSAGAMLISAVAVVWVYLKRRNMAQQDNSD